jgi:predicted aspartyl protease
VLIAGAFDEAGSPTIKIRVGGDLGSRDYAATIDTGFTGFVALPLVEMIPLGLATQPGAASVMLGDGTIVENLVAQGSVILGSHSAVGAILLDETSADVLIGMAFLRAFAVTLIVTEKIVALCDAAERLEAVVEFIRSAR